MVLKNYYIIKKHLLVTTLKMSWGNVQVKSDNIFSLHVFTLKVKGFFFFINMNYYSFWEVASYNILHELTLPFNKKGQI